METDVAGKMTALEKLFEVSVKGCQSGFKWGE